MNRKFDLSSFKSKYLSIMEGGFPGRIFWVSYSLLLIIHCIENTSVIYLDAAWVKGIYLLRNFLYFILLIKIGFFSRFQKKEIIYAAIFGFVGILSLIGSKDFALLEFGVIVFAAKDELPRRLVMVFTVVKGLGILTTLFLWRIGVLAAIYYQDDRVGYYNTYGFCHRNVLAANIVVICLAWFYLRYKYLKIWDLAIWSVIAAIMYKFTLSRTGLIVLLLIIFGMFLFKKKQKLIFGNIHLKKIVLGGFLILLLLSIAGTLFYSGNSEIWKFIDRIFTKRFQFANQCFEEYGLSLFGQKLPFVSSIEAQSSKEVRLILDNSYMRALLHYGIIPGALFLGTYFKALSISLKRQNAKLIVSLIVFAIFGLSERYMLDVYYQFPMLVAWVGYFLKQKGTLETKLPLEHGKDVLALLRKSGWKRKRL